MRKINSHIGAHVTTAGGLINGVIKANDIGAGCIQVFSSSPQSWKRRQIMRSDIDAFIAKKIEYKIRKVYIHAPYLVNLATANRMLLKQSIQTLTYELQFCHDIGAYGVIVHVGSGAGGWGAWSDQIYTAIEQILSTTPEDTIFIVENSAGREGSIARTIEECGDIAKKIPDRRLQFCIDTQHAFAAGYNICDPICAQELANDIDTHIGINRLAVFHVNDSKTACGSARDRHENIGEGKIGTKGLAVFLKNSLFNNIDMVLETPGFEGKGPDRENIKRLTQINSV